MTLVASLSPFGCPLMLGDILITGAPGPQTMAMLPTIGSLHLVDDTVVDLSRIKSLAQKICIINDRLVVGWAGRYDAAKRIISSMRKFEWNTSVTLEDVQQLLARTYYDDQAAISLAGIFLHNDSFGEFGLNAMKRELPLLNRCRFIGTGTTNLLRGIQGVSALDTSTENPWHNAVALTLEIGGFFMGEEMSNFGGLIDDFGGAFEIAVFQDGKFTKLDDILYCFWLVSEHSEREIALSSHTTFVKVKYHNDILLVRRADFADRAQMRNSEFIISPMGGDVDPRSLQDLQSPDLNATHDCHYLAVRSDGGYEVLAIVNLFARGARVRFERHDDGVVSFAVHRELLKHMHHRVVQRFYPEPR